MGIRISDMPDLTGSKSNDNSLLLITDLSGSTSDLQNRKLKISTFNQIFSNNKLLDGLSSYENFYGTGEDGDVTFSTSTNIPSENHGEIVVKQYKTCTINLGVTVTTSNPCRGLVIFCTGDLNVAGTLTMTAKGGGVGNKATEFNYNITDTSLSFNTSSNGGSGVQSWNFSPSGSVWYPKYRQTVPLRNPVAAPSTPSQSGTAGVFSCGAGGSGTIGSSNCPTAPALGGPGGLGGIGSLFAGGGGGGGGGGAYCTFTPSGGTAVNEIGGNGSAGQGPGASGGGGGAGNAAGQGGPFGGPNPNGAPGSAGSTGTGGLLIIIVRGNVSITGTISSNGSGGGSGGGSALSGGSGGSSGGGRVIIVYGGTYSNTGTVQANGGSGPGSSGGAGSITVQKVDQ
jgi:hypothetical protein